MTTEVCYLSVSKVRRPPVIFFPCCPSLPCHEVSCTKIGCIELSYLLFIMITCFFYKINQKLGFFPYKNHCSFSYTHLKYNCKGIKFWMPATYFFSKLAFLVNSSTRLCSLFIMGGFLSTISTPFWCEQIFFITSEAMKYPSSLFLDNIS